MQFKNKKKLLDLNIMEDKEREGGFRSAESRSSSVDLTCADLAAFCFLSALFVSECKPLYFLKQRCFLLTAQHMAKEAFLVLQNFQE